jgi:hypothetical protein
MDKTRATFKSRVTHFASSKARGLPTSLVLPLALLVALALTLLAVPASGAGTANGVAAKAAISQVTVNGTKVTISGRVTLPVDTATQSRRTRVALSLIDGLGKVEQLSTKIDAKGRFKATKTTKLTGQLTVVAQVKIGGKTSGRQVRKAFAGPGSAPGGGTSKGAGTAAGATGTGSGAAAGGGGAPTGTPLVGLFKFEPGTQAISGKITGTYFRMMANGSPVTNGDSPFADKSYTPLRPGTDGGLSTVEYQPPPSPAFAGIGPEGEEDGNALAGRIVQPQTFFQINFSTVTDSVALPFADAASVPVILNDNGTLSGQITAWSAAWNGLYFSQGSPKPDGSLGGTWGYGGTTPLTGTYNAATGHYQISWQSLIEGGPFGGFSGQWFLEGTFVPAS